MKQELRQSRLTQVDRLLEQEFGNRLMEYMSEDRLIEQTPVDWLERLALLGDRLMKVVVLCGKLAAAPPFWASALCSRMWAFSTEKRC